MSWKLAYLPEYGVVEATFQGVVGAEDLLKSVIAALNMAKTNNTLLFLADCQELAPNKSLVDVYELGRFMEKQSLDHRIREAVILPKSPEAAEGLKFYETVGRNRGFDIRVFPDRASALNWLLG